MENKRAMQFEAAAADDSTPFASFTFSASPSTFNCSFSGNTPRLARRKFSRCRTSSSPIATPSFSLAGVASSPEVTKEKPIKADNTSSLISISRVLKGIPHSPHFYPLRNLSDDSKSLLKEAWDEIFEEAVDRIQSTRPDDGFWVEAGKLWKTLEELQGMGYCVIGLRRRVIEFSDVVLEKRGFMSEILRLTNRAELHRMEKSRLEYEVLQLNARIEDEKGKVAKMEDELHKFDDAFAKLLIQPVTKF